MRNKVDFRKATHRDVDGICALFYEGMVFHEKRDEYFRSSADAVDRFREFVSQQVGNSRSRLVVATTDDGIVGYKLAFLHQRPPTFALKDSAVITDLVVSEEYRRRGIGFRIGREQERWLRQHGICWLEAQVATKNEVAISFWWNRGFTPHIEMMGKEIDDSE